MRSSILALKYTVSIASLPPSLPIPPPVSPPRSLPRRSRQDTLSMKIDATTIRFPGRRHRRPHPLYVSPSPALAALIAASANGAHAPRSASDASTFEHIASTASLSAASSAVLRRSPAYATKLFGFSSDAFSDASPSSPSSPAPPSTTSPSSAGPGWHVSHPQFSAWTAKGFAMVTGAACCCARENDRRPRA